MVGELRHPLFQVALVARRDVGVGLLCPAQRLGEQRAVLVQLLGVPQNHPGARLHPVGQVKAHHARDILPEIHHEHSGLRAGYLRRLIDLLLTDGLQCHGAHDAARRRHRARVARIQLLRLPVPARVKGLAVEYLGFLRAHHAEPVLARGDVLCRAVLVGQAKQCPKLAVAVELDLPLTQHGEHELRAVLAPAGGNLDLQSVQSLGHDLADARRDAVVADVRVVTVGGIQLGVVCFLVVQVRLVVAQPAGIQHCVRHRLLGDEIAIEMQDAVPLVLLRADPCAGERIQCAVEKQLLARGGAACVILDEKVGVEQCARREIACREGGGLCRRFDSSAFVQHFPAIQVGQCQGVRGLCSVRAVGAERPRQRRCGVLSGEFGNRYDVLQRCAVKIQFF